MKNIYSYKNNKSKKFQGLLTERSYQKDINPNIKGKSIDININKYMNDQEILDYLNTNNTEKKNLIKKIMNQKLENAQPKPVTKRKIQLNNSKSYSYIYNNYNYYTESQQSPSAFNINNNRGTTRFNYSYKYFDNENITKEINKQKNTKIIFNKKHTIRPCCSNEAIFYRNYTGKNKEENNRNNINYLSLNNNKKFQKKNSFNKKQNINTIHNIAPFDNKINCIYSPPPRIILLNQKNKFKSSESTNKIIKRKKQFFQNQNSLTVNSTNIIKKKENTDKDKKLRKTKIPISSTHHMKSISLDANNNKIDDKKMNNKKYSVKNVVNEQFHNVVTKNNKKEGTSNSENENLEISVQSMNDSKMMELAKNYIKQEDNLNRNEITQILNCKKGWI